MVTTTIKWDWCSIKLLVYVKFYIISSEHPVDVDHAVCESDLMVKLRTEVWTGIGYREMLRVKLKNHQFKSMLKLNIFQVTYWSIMSRIITTILVITLIASIISIPS